MALKPEVIEIPYGTDKHRDIVAAVMQRFRMSRQYMSNRYTQWSRMEERALGYVNLTTNDRTRDQLRRQGKPQYVTIDVPYSYAMLMTAHTYWTSVFLSRNPVLQYQGTKGESQNNERAVEAVMQYQLDAGHMLLPLYLWLMDVGKYGVGILGNSWVEEDKYISQIVEVEQTFAGLSLGKKKQRQTVRIPGYKGNKSFNVRPQDFFPDPRVPLQRFQDGEFCGRFIEVGWNTILKREQQGLYYNVKELQKRLIARRNELRDRGSPQLVLPASMDTLFYHSIFDDPDNHKNQKAFIELEEMTIELVPRDWGLGNSPYPEKWVFVLGNSEVLLCCMPLGAYHGEFEFSILEYEIEPYALNARSLLEIVDPLNQILTWLFNSHMYNVRKVVNDQLIIDPSRVVMKDFTDPDSGRLIRLKPEAYGTDPKATYSQLAVQDITRTHVGDAQSVMELMQRVLGVTDNVMGMVNPGGRKTATEVRTSSTFGVNRLKTNAEYMSAMGFTPWARRMLQNTQQRYSGEELYRIAGTAVQDASQILVTPEMIAGEYQFTPVDGTMPIDRFAQANLWKEIMVAAQRMPQLAMSLDWMKMMGYVAQISGVKNFDSFKINVVPDEAIGNAVAAGNSVPIPNGGSNGEGRSRGTSSNPGVPGAPRVSGVGPTG